MNRYVTPELELVHFLAMDVIMTSAEETATSAPETEETQEDETPIG